MAPWFTPPIVIPAAIVAVIVAFAIHLAIASAPLGDASIGLAGPSKSNGEGT